MRIAATIVLALTITGCSQARSGPRLGSEAASTAIANTVAMNLGDLRGTEQNPAPCGTGFIQVHVVFEIQHWPQGAEGIEVEVVEVDINTLPPGEPVSVMPLPIVLARHDVPREGFAQWAGSLPVGLTVGSVLWCRKPCTGGNCTLHGDQGRDSTEDDNTFELDAQVRIYGTDERGKRVTLSERFSARKRVKVHCAPCTVAVASDASRRSSLPAPTITRHKGDRR